MSDTTTEPNPTPQNPSTSATPAPATQEGPARLPDDHPLVTAYARQKQENESLKAKVGEVKTLEERVAQIEKAARESEERALRAEVANAKGLTPTQAKRLVGSTREELEADADELLADIGASKRNGNHVPDEGNNPTPGSDPMREFTRNLFADRD